MCLSRVVVLVLCCAAILSCAGQVGEHPGMTETGTEEERIRAELREVVQLMNQGQSARADSLVTALFYEVRDTASPDLLINIAEELVLTKVVSGQFREAMAILDAIPETVFNQATRLNRDRLLTRKAMLINEMGQTVQALEMLRPIVDYHEKADTPSEVKLLFTSTYAGILQHAHQYDNAVHWFQRSLSIAYSTGTDPRNIAVIHNNLAILLENLNRPEEALEELERSLELNIRHNIISGISQNLNNIANSLQSVGRVQESIDTLRAAIRLNTEAGAAAPLIRNYYNLGNTFLADENPLMASEYFERGLEAARSIDMHFGIMFNASGLARAANQLNRYHLAMPLAEEALMWARRFENLHIQTDMLLLISEMHEQNSNFRLALRFAREHKVVSDSFQELRNQQSIEEVRSRFSFDVITAENELLRQELLFSEARDELRRNILLSLAAVMLIVSGLLMLIVRQNNLIKKKNAYLAELNESRENLINIIVHDLRSPLSSLMASLEIIEELNPRTSDEYNDIFEVAQLSAEKLRTMINGLLDIRSIENATEPLHLLPYSIGNLTNGVIENFHSTAARKKIEIDARIDSFEAVTHAEYYTRIVENLVSNALKYSYSGTTVTVKLSHAADRWTLVVQDQGQGFSEKDKQEAFQMFKKLSARPTENEPSSGLGLYTIKLLVERLNGTVTLESEHGVGATFTCTFPHTSA